MHDGFFDIIKGEPRIRPEALVIPEMYDLWKKDSSEDKFTAHKQLFYIYHCVNPMSAYAKTDPLKRESLVRKDFLSKAGLKVDDVVSNALNKYKMLVIDSDASAIMLEGIDSAITNVSNYIKTAEITDGKGGNLMSIVNAAKQLPVLRATREQLFKAMQEGYEAGVKTKRDVEPNIFDEDY